MVWGASASEAYGSPAVFTDDQGRAFGYYTSGGAVAYCAMWTPVGALWNIPSPIDLWAPCVERLATGAAAR